MALSESQKKERADYLEKYLKITECSQGQPYAFISYASDDWEKVFKEAAVPLQQTYGLCVYADKAFDKVNDKWIVPMLRNVRGAGVMLVFVSQSYIESYACFLELLTAVNSKKQIVFISLEEKLHLGATTDQPTIERGVKNEILNQGANISTNTNNTSNDVMRAMKSAYTSVSTLLEQDALSKYDISDAFINFFRDASVNKKTINDLKAIKRTIASIDKGVFDKKLIVGEEQPAADLLEEAAQQVAEGESAQTPVLQTTVLQTSVLQEKAVSEERTKKQEDHGDASRQPESQFEKKKSDDRNKCRTVIVASAVAAVLLIAFLVFILSGGFTRISASQMCNRGEQCLDEKDYAKAEDFYQEALETYPKSEEAYLGLAEVYIEQEEYKDAVQILEEGLEEIDSEAISSKLEEAEELAEAEAVEADGWFHGDSFTLNKCDEYDEFLCEVNIPDGYTYDDSLSAPESGFVSLDRADGEGWIWVQNEVGAPMYYTLLNDGVLPTDEYPELEDYKNYQIEMEVIGTAFGGSDVILAVETYTYDEAEYGNVYVCIQYDDGEYKEFLAVDCNSLNDVDQWSKDDFLNLAVDLFGH